MELQLSEERPDELIDEDELFETTESHFAFPVDVHIDTSDGI